MPQHSDLNAGFSAKLAGDGTATFEIEKRHSLFYSPHGGHQGFKKKIKSNGGQMTFCHRSVVLLAHLEVARWQSSGRGVAGRQQYDNLLKRES